MRIRLSQLRRIIKEEVRRTLNETEEPLRVAKARPLSGNHQALKAKLGPDEYRRLFTGPQSRYGEVSHGFGDRALEHDAMDAFWLGVKPAFEALVKGTTYRPQEADEVDEEYVTSFPEYAKLEDAVAKFESAYAAWLPSAEAGRDAAARSTYAAGKIPSSIRGETPLTAKQEHDRIMGYGTADDPSYPHLDQW
jgi:hypothetical protein